MESTKLQWNGDVHVDLNDGTIKEQYDAYKIRLAFAESVGVNGEEDHSSVASQLETISNKISDDLTFIYPGNNIFSTSPSVSIT